MSEAMHSNPVPENTIAGIDPAPAPRRYSLWSALLIFWAVRVLVLIAAYSAPQDRSGRPDLFWPDMPLARWDYGHYMHIMVRGYPADNPACEQIAFFPGYPLAGRLLLPWFRPDLALSIVSHLAATVAACLMYLWARRLYSARIALWCVVLISVYPPAMFFSAGYADALLLMCVAAALYFLSRGLVFCAALASAYATLTRPTGLILAAIVVLWAFFQNREAGWQSRGLRAVLLGLVAIGGLVGYQGYLWKHYGRPDAFVAAQSNWGHEKAVPNPIERILTLKPVLQPPLRAVKFALRGEFTRFGDPLETWNPVFNLIVLVAALVGLIRPGPIPRMLFLIPLMVLLMAWLPDPYRGGRMVGLPRYHLMSVPVFLSLAAWMARCWPAALRYALVIGLVLLQCMYARQFADWQYIG